MIRRVQKRFLRGWLLEQLWSIVGSTPAKNVSGEMHIELLDKPLDSDGEPPNPDNRRRWANMSQSMTVVPKDGPLLFGGPLDFSFSEDELADIAAQRRFIAAYGNVTYFDIFEIKEAYRVLLFLRIGRWGDELLPQTQYY